MIYNLLLRFIKENKLVNKLKNIKKRNSDDTLKQSIRLNPFDVIIEFYWYTNMTQTEYKIYNEKWKEILNLLIYKQKKHESKN